MIIVGGAAVVKQESYNFLILFCIKNGKNTIFS